MKLSRENTSPTSLKLSFTAEPAELEAAKKLVVKRLSQNMNVPGFRKGKAPAHIVEKQVDQSLLQSEFMDAVINQLYSAAIEREKIRPIAQPAIEVTKFVPFTTLEFIATMDVIGEIVLPDYKKMKQSRNKVNITAEDVKTVLQNLAQRGAEKTPVERAVKNGDEVIIDFVGVDAKTKEPIAGADGTDYPLEIGSKTFIPGFEEELIGAKPGAIKTFDIIFPADYGAATLRKKKVTFTVTMRHVNEVKPAKIDDTFAATLGPFKSVAELKADIKKQLQAEKEQEAKSAFDNELLEKIASKTQVSIPKQLIDDEIERIEEEEKRNTLYRGQTWQEHLDAEGITAEKHKERQRGGAEIRVKGGLILGEIAQAEKITVTPEEVDMRMQLLRGQYSDPAMLAELDKPENRRDIMSRLLTEKTLDALRAYVSSS